MTALTVICAQYLVVLAPVLVALVWWRLPALERRTLLVRGVIVLVAAVVLAKGGGALFNDPRPFVVQHTTPLIPHVADNGFPSDHTLLAAACAFLLVPFSLPAAVGATLVAIMIGVARVASRLHSPLDIAASLLFAAVANAIAWIAVKGRR